ncbi:MAG TPA: YicC family protein, partial [Clostridiales bacterium]|nr:YicC family protein [Clostridiales bacterium]
IVQIDAPEAEEAVVQLNISLAKAYIDAFTKLSEEFGIENDIKLSDLALKTDIFTVHKEPANEELIWNAVSQVLDEAIDAFVAMRETEGKQLSEDIASRCDIILKFVEEIDQRSPIVVSEYFEKLAQRIKELLHDAKVDEQRLLTEAAVFADKTAVTEETVRLRSHIDQMKSLLNSCEPVGRKMDFLVQEMNREANTIGSKCQDTAIASLVINIKAEIEKIREQIQNIE